MWPFKKSAAVAPSGPVESKSRNGDGTVIGDLIQKGIYSSNAGMEKVGHFDPAVAPFRTFTNGKCGLTAGPMADQLLEMLRDPAVANMTMMMGGQSGDLAVELGKKLLLRSTRDVLNTFQTLANDDAVGKYLIVTTTMPFHLTYWTGERVLVAEAELELKMNGLANLLLNDADFATVHTHFEFREKAASLYDVRSEEVERMKQWAVERM